MCSKAEARAAHEARTAAISNFAALVDRLPPPPPRLSPGTRAIGELAELFRGVAATVPLPRSKKE